MMSMSHIIARAVQGEPEAVLALPQVVADPYDPIKARQAWELACSMLQGRKYMPDGSPEQRAYFAASQAHHLQLAIVKTVAHVAAAPGHPHALASFHILKKTLCESGYTNCHDWVVSTFEGMAAKKSPLSKAAAECLKAVKKFKALTKGKNRAPTAQTDGSGEGVERQAGLVYTVSYLPVRTHG